MASAHVSQFDSDEEEFNYFTAGDIFQAEVRDLEKALEVDDLGSDIYVSDVSDTESDSAESTGSTRAEESDPDDDVVLADIAGLRWSRNRRTLSTKAFSGPTPGVKTIMDSSKTELDFLNLFFSPDMYQLIAQQTNLYAKRRIDSAGTRSKTDWYDTTADEIKAFLGASIVMGIMKTPVQDLFWYKDKLFHPSCLENKFSRHRFEQLQQYLHTADTSNSNQPATTRANSDRLAQIRPVLDKVQSACLKEYAPHCEVSIDEAMIGFSGRLSFKQYVPLKPTKRGIKVWVRADPYNGYVNDFQVYTGRVRGGPEKDLGSRVVKDLMAPILDKGHRLFCDSFFSSPALFKELLENETYGCGTVKANRKGLPPNLQLLKPKTQGESIVQQKGDMQVITWRDKKVLNILSTIDGEPTNVNRKQKDGSIVQVPCPHAVMAYNQHMNGVDHADQLRATYSTARKSLKWWKYIFYFLFDICIVNAFILMKESVNHKLTSKTGREKCLTQKDFREKLAHQLLDRFNTKRKRGSDIAETLTPVQHWPVIMPTKKTCKMCQKLKIRSERVTGCEQCKVNLCIPCFKPYHVMLK